MQLINFPQKNIEMFTWSPRDISRIDPNIAQYHLNNFSEVWLVKQKPHKFMPNRQQTICEEVNKLLGVGFNVDV